MATRTSRATAATIVATRQRHRANRERRARFHTPRVESRPSSRFERDASAREDGPRRWKRTAETNETCPSPPGTRRMSVADSVVLRNATTTRSRCASIARTCTAAPDASRHRAGKKRRASHVERRSLQIGTDQPCLAWLVDRGSTSMQSQMIEARSDFEPACQDDEITRTDECFDSGVERAPEAHAACALDRAKCELGLLPRGCHVRTAADTGRRRSRTGDARERQTRLPTTPLSWAASTRESRESSTGCSAVCRACPRGTSRAFRIRGPRRPCECERPAASARCRAESPAVLRGRVER